VRAFVCLAILAPAAVWADEAADRSAIEATVSALNAPPSSPSNLFTVDFPNAADLKRFREQGRIGTLVISREPMGEATWYPSLAIARQRFVTRSVTFLAADMAVVVATYEQNTVLFVLKQVQADWRIASFRALPEAQTKVR